MTKQETGKLGESLACDYLIKKGYTILNRNWSKPRWGEIDIIAKHEGIIKFIEVRTKKSKEYGDPIESVSPKKLKSLQNSINYYITTETKNDNEFAYTVEFVTVILDANTKKAVKISHFVS